MENIAGVFGEPLVRAVQNAADGLCEIRIRADEPTVLYVLNKPYFIGDDGTLFGTMPQNPFIISFERLRTAFSRLCSFSLYKHMNDIGSGFITVNGGHRIGVCGSAVVKGGAVHSVTDITSLNIRVAGQVRGCADNIFEKTDFGGGVLLCGKPSSGKTTLLRDIARRLSESGREKVCVIDERLEIAAKSHGGHGFDVGLSDVYSGYPKGCAMVLAVRTMSPDYMICDELTGDCTDAVSAAFGCGVSMIASVHCSSLDEARRNLTVKTLMKTGAFRRLVFLDGNIPADIAAIADEREYFSDED